MNEKKDDPGRKNDSQDDTAALLESLFKETEDSTIKVVKRRIRPKSGVKKRVIPKQEKDSEDKISKTRARKQGRLLTSERSMGATKDKLHSRGTSLPDSRVLRDSQNKERPQKSRRKPTVGTRSTPRIGKDGDKRIAKPGTPKKESLPSKTTPTTDEERTEALDKTVLHSIISMASGIKGREKELLHKLPDEESPKLKTGESVGEKNSEAGDLKVTPPADVEEIDEADEEITEVLGKSTINSLISALEGSDKERRDGVSTQESTVPEEEAGAEIFFDSNDWKEQAPVDIKESDGADEEITEILGKSTINSLISDLEGNGKERQDQPSAEESSILCEGTADAARVFDSDDLKEETSVDVEGIAEVTENESSSQEKPAAPGSITIEDSLFEASAREAYPESALEEKPLSEEEQVDVEKASQSIDLSKERPSDSTTEKLTEEKIPSQERPATSTSIPFETSRGKADMLEVHHILEEEKPSIQEDKEEEDVDKASVAVGPAPEPLFDASEPREKKPQFQEELVSSLASSEDFMAQVGQQERHHKPVAEKESTPKGMEGDIVEVSEREEPREEEPADLEEDAVLTEEELQLLTRSGRRSMIIRIGLPFVLFGILAVILSIQFAPLDFIRQDQEQKPADEKSVEVSSPKKQGVTPEASKKKALTERQGIQLPTSTPLRKEIFRALVPRKQVTIPEAPKKTVPAISPEIQPLTSETPTVQVIKNNEGSIPPEQDTTLETSKETVVTAEQEIRLDEPPHKPVTSLPSSNAVAKVKIGQKETLTSFSYSVYLGSYATLERAEKAISTYNENGLLSLFWQEVNLGEKGTWYRVFAGHFETKGEAEEYIKEQQLADAEVQKTKQSTSIGSASVKDVVGASDEQRLLPEVTAGSSYPYSVYLGSYKDLDRARKVVSGFQTKGTSYWVKTDLGDKGIWYRVYVGCFRTRDEAEIFIKTHQIVGGESRHITYANLIGTYTSDEELDKMRYSLLNLEFSPYVIEASGGGFHLFTGAFYQKDRAEKERRDLEAKGIQSQLVER
jgi:cell division septation protein DedD